MKLQAIGEKAPQYSFNCRRRALGMHLTFQGTQSANLYTPYRSHIRIIIHIHIIIIIIIIEMSHFLIIGPCQKKAKEFTKCGWQPVNYCTHIARHIYLQKYGRVSLSLSLPLPRYLSLACHNFTNRPHLLPIPL